MKKTIFITEDILNHEVMQNDKEKSRFHAFIELLFKADNDGNIPQTTITALSVNFRWSWDKTKRFLDKLEDLKLIYQKTKAKTLNIRIEDFIKYKNETQVHRQVLKDPMLTTEMQMFCIANSQTKDPDNMFKAFKKVANMEGNIFKQWTKFCFADKHGKEFGVFPYV